MVRKGTTRVTGRKSTIVGESEQGRLQSATRGVATETPGGRVNPDELISLEIEKHQDWSTRRLLTQLRRQGLDVNEAKIERVRSKFMGRFPPDRRN
jgi:hypothetical protein